MSVIVSGQVQLQQGQLQVALTGPRSAARLAVEAAQRNTYNAAKLRSPVDKGTLRNGHSMPPVSISGLKVTATVEVLADYAVPVHEGSRAHAILPRRAKALSWKANGTRVFSRGVWHPGAQPRPWLRLAMEEQGALLGFTPTGIRR